MGVLYSMREVWSWVGYAAPFFAHLAAAFDAACGKAMCSPHKCMLCSMEEVRFCLGRIAPFFAHIDAAIGAPIGVELHPMDEVQSWLVCAKPLVQPIGAHIPALFVLTWQRL